MCKASIKSTIYEISSNVGLLILKHGDVRIWQVTFLGSTAWFWGLELRPTLDWITSLLRSFCERFGLRVLLQWFCEHSVIQRTCALWLFSPQRWLLLSPCREGDMWFYTLDFTWPCFHFEAPLTWTLWQVQQFFDFWKGRGTLTAETWTFWSMTGRHAW